MPHNFLSVWWTQENLTAYANQTELLWGQDPDLYNQMMERAFEILNDNPDHADQYEIVRRWVYQKNQDPINFQRLLPHEIGIAGSSYGSGLLETIAYQELLMPAKILGLDIKVFYTIDSNKPKLNEAFQLCVDISTCDKAPLLPKIMQGQARGLFTPMFGATKLN
jgi:hypothetical protein